MQNEKQGFQNERLIHFFPSIIFSRLNEKRPRDNMIKLNSQAFSQNFTISSLTVRVLNADDFNTLNRKSDKVN
jgi:hypothetical protein